MLASSTAVPSLVHARFRVETATVTATEESEIFVLGAKEFHFLVESNPALAAYMKDLAAERAYDLEQWENK